MFNFIGSSSSEYETDGELDQCEGPSPTAVKNSQASSLVRWFVVFICLVAICVHHIRYGYRNAAAVQCCILSASLTSIPLLITIAAAMPATLYLLKKYLISDTELFVKYTVCPACYSLYKIDDCFVEDEKNTKKVLLHKISNVTTDGTPLLTKVHMSGGKVKYVPRYTYSYQSIKVSLQRLLNRPGFAEQLEHWRYPHGKEGFMSDVYDGQVWVTKIRQIPH